MRYGVLMALFVLAAGAAKTAARLCYCRDGWLSVKFMFVINSLEVLVL